MNIFVLSTDPVEAARWQCDKHVVKMMVESVQLLSTAMWELTGAAPYRKTHFNHPCAIWTRESLGNYQWLWDHCDALGREYTARHGKTHKSHTTLLNDIPRVLPFAKTELTPFANCTPYTQLPVLDAYRELYRNEKRSIAVWKNGNPPSWF